MRSRDSTYFHISETVRILYSSSTAVRRTNQNPLHIAATPVSTVLPII